MTDQLDQFESDQFDQAPLTPEEALEERDITLALSPMHAVIALIGLYLLFRFIRSLRG
jgi:hypothetical protein